MNRRQAKKLLKPLRGGRTAKINKYWWFRVYDYILGRHNDHRVINAIRMTKENYGNYRVNTELPHSLAQERP